MSPTKSSSTTRFWHQLIWPGVLIGIGIAGWYTQSQWLPHARRFMSFIQNREPETGAKAETTGAPMAVPDSLSLSPVAWRNIGLITGVVQPADFVKVVSVPATVIERPGRSQIEIVAPMTGVVTQVYPLEREGSQPGQPLFELRLTHEDFVAAQSEFLTRLQSLDVADKELNRLRNVGAGVLPGKRIIEQEYERDQAEATLAALRQSLLLHGMSQEQIADMEQTRTVLRDITVAAPPYAPNHEHGDFNHQYHVQSIKVNRGQSVVAGQLLAILADHCLLYVEGKAIEDDASRLIQASKQNASVVVVPVSGNYEADEVMSLTFQSVADQVDIESRALKFYLLLPNVLVDGPEGSEDHFVAWKFRPGQRMEARIPTSEVMRNKIVLPNEAVVIEGPNAFVFEQNGDSFDRIDVHVLFRDKDFVVLENDGTLAGSTVAMNGAFQMHLAMKNQSGGAIDPHAGHSH